jgi:hypothetical protein
VATLLVMQAMETQAAAAAFVLKPVYQSVK